MLRDKRKWISLGDGCWVAPSGMADIGEIIRHLALGSDIHVGPTQFPFRFCFVLRERLRDVEHWSTLEPGGGGAPEWGTSLLITDGKSVWATTDSLYPYLVEHGDLVANGSGWAFAQGAMHAAAKELEGASLRGKVTQASLSGAVVHAGLEAAIHFDTQCGGEPWVETLS